MPTDPGINRLPTPDPDTRDVAPGEPDLAPPAHLLVVEDDAEISALLARFLRSAGYRVSVAQNGAEMDHVMAAQQVDLVLLDLMLPGEHGHALCRRIRATSTAAIIMVTALSELADIVVGLETGADDYVAKPFELRELAARIRAVLRRGAAPTPVSPEQQHFAGWQFHPARRVLYSPAGFRVSLTGAEADLLLSFCQNPRRVLTRQHLIELTRTGADSTQERGIDMLVSRLRRKLSVAGRQPDLIRTVRHDGYSFHPDAR